MNGKIANGRKLSELYTINIFNMMEEDMNKPYDVDLFADVSKRSTKDMKN